jgi:hypothetical protein
MNFGGGQTSGVSVSGIVVTDTTWNQSNSPYTLTGNILVHNGVTLTIQAGTTINLGNYYIMVNGTLQAIGNSANPITFKANTNGGYIIFNPFSAGWNDSTSTGCILENSILNCPVTVSNSAKINNDIIYDGINVQSTGSTLQRGTALISNSFIKGMITVGDTHGSAAIINNTIVGGGIYVGWLVESTERHNYWQHHIRLWWSSNKC